MNRRPRWDDGKSDFEKLIAPQTMQAFDVKPWHLGLCPVPWWRKAWSRVTFGRARVRRQIRRENEAGCE